MVTFLLPLGSKGLTYFFKKNYLVDNVKKLFLNSLRMLMVMMNCFCEADDHWEVLIQHCIKSARIRCFSGPHFPAFGLNTEICSVNPHIQSKCGKMWNRKNPNKDNFMQCLFPAGTFFSGSHYRKPLNKARVG